MKTVTGPKTTVTPWSTTASIGVDTDLTKANSFGVHTSTVT